MNIYTSLNSWVGEIGSRAPPGQLNSEIIFSTPRISA